MKFPLTLVALLLSGCLAQVTPDAAADLCTTLATYPTILSCGTGYEITSCPSAELFSGRSCEGGDSADLLRCCVACPPHYYGGNCPGPVRPNLGE